MKKTIILFISLLLANTLSAAGFPNISDSDNEYWYYLKFTQGVYVVASNGEDVVCKSAIPTGKSSQLWKVEGSAADGYTFTNKLGLQLYAMGTSQGSEIRAGRSPKSLEKFKINTRGSNYTITPFTNTGQAFNCWGGMGFKNDVKLYDSGDANAPMAFIAEADMKIDNALVPVIPYPQSVSVKDSRFDLHELTMILFCNREKNNPNEDEDLKKMAQRMADDFQRTAGISCDVKDSRIEVLWPGKYLEMILDESRPSEGYKLSVSNDGIQVSAKDFGGFFNALQTLRQLMPSAIYGKELKAHADWT